MLLLFSPYYLLDLCPFFATRGTDLIFFLLVTDVVKRENLLWV